MERPWWRLTFLICFMPQVQVVMLFFLVGKSLLICLSNSDNLGDLEVVVSLRGFLPRQKPGRCLPPWS